MKNRFTVLVSWLTLLCSYGLSPGAWAQTVIFNASPSAQPGEAISLQGNFSATAKVYLSAGSASPVAVPILTQMAGQATVQVPSNLGVNVYQVWVDDNGQASPRVYVNQAQGHHFDSPEVSPGGRMRLFGRNLQLGGGGAQVRFVGSGGGDAQVDASQSDAYTLVFNAPTSLQAGVTYQVVVSNGRGAETTVEQTVKGINGGSDYFNLGVGWAPKINYSGNVYNVKTDGRLSKKASGNGYDNDWDAVQGAIDKASNDGGGVVYLPAGTYKLAPGGGGSLIMRNRVVVRGAGKDQTTIKYGYGWPSSDKWGLIWGDTQQSGLADLSLQNVNESGFWIQNMTGRGTEVFMQRIRFDLGQGDWLWWANSNKLVIANSDFTQGVDDKAGYHGPIQLNGCTNFIVANNNFTYAVDGLNLNGAHEGVFENNKVYRDGSARYPSYLVNHVLILNFAQNVAVTNNLFKVINGPAQNSNDGEAIIAEGGGSGGGRADEDAGTVTAAWGNMLQDNGKWWGQPQKNPVVAIVSGNGTGQVRNIVSRNGNALTLDRAWDVVPSSGSRYAIFNWGSRNWLVEGNTFEGNRRGITLYQNATSQVAIVNNTLTNSGSIDLTPFQGTAGYQQFVPMFNNQIVGNNVGGTDGSNGVFIGVHAVQHLQANTFGTAVINLEVRGNTLTAHTPNVPAIVDDSYPEGYLNFLQFQQGGSRYNDEKIPAVLGSIFQNNTAINCANAVYLNSGSYGTLVCNTNLINTPNLMLDNRITGVSHTSVGTASCLGSTVSSLRTPENPDNTEAGLTYNYYEGFWNRMPDVNSISPLKSGTVNSFDLGMRQRDYSYLIRYSGYITVPADGQYTFFSSSDDGSRLYIGSTMVLDNDGPHEEKEASGSIGLKAGTHAFSVEYWQSAGSQVFDVTYLGPGVQKQPVTSAVLRRGTGGLRNPENPTVTTAGLDYKYVEGSWSTIPDFGGLAATKTGTTTAFELTPRQRNTSYAMQYTGYITVPTDGQYTFFTGSDDGSKLYIGSTQVVDNDGMHGYVEKSGTIGLKAGTHALTVSYVQGTGGQSLDVSYVGPNISKQAVPASALRRSTMVASSSDLRDPENPNNTTNGLDYKYYEGYWSSFPDMNSVNPVKTGVTTSFDLGPRQRDYSYVMQYTGYITVPTDGRYTFFTGSDDGSELYIGSTQVVDNDGLHEYREQSGTIGLKAGTHAFTVLYLQGAGNQTLNVSYLGPNITKQAIPSSALVRTASGTNPGPSTSLRVPENPSNTVAGMDFKYYEGFWSQVPNFNNLTPVSTGTAAIPNLDGRQRDYNYGLMYTGYVTVPTDGLYTFTTGSDDGSELFIGSTQVVDNDGIHSYIEKSGTIGLQAGTHAITIAYAQGIGGQNLTVSYAGPNFAKQVIPASALKRSTTGTIYPTLTSSNLRVPENPANTVSGIDYKYYEGFWNSLPNFDGLNVVKSGTLGAPGLDPRQRDYGYAIRYTGYITVPTDGQYTFYSSSDDGTQLLIGSTLVVNNDGLHDAGKWQSGSIGLQAGTHAFTVTYLQQGGGQVLNLAYEGPGQGRQSVTGNMMRRVNGSSLTETTGRSVLGSSSANGLSVYPNPNEGAFTVEFSSKVTQAATLTLTDNLGRVVKEQKLQVQAGFNQVPVDTQNAADGMYQLSLLGANGERQIQKVSIKH
ncbi:PA14 domain-containing protein [Hymenobacter sp. GOD-10R]|uniref:PA14 domain-containing protein n=1 Tax=Hymenobacter sp. GOD-10R TaxID=3093922 RepID=UPI002D76C194|nr:PA14 domain-containing protein [Hymenobacter sp. GOD-10R]WRQ26194.1 PA14 domain-containing protein [Hymenobacter sp. GOD-10R]